MYLYRQTPRGTFRVTEDLSLISDGMLGKEVTRDFLVQAIEHDPYHVVVATARLDTRSGIYSPGSSVYVATGENNAKWLRIDPKRIEADHLGPIETGN